MFSVNNFMIFFFCLVLPPPLIRLSFTQLTDFSEIKSLGSPEDGVHEDGLNGEFELGVLLSMRQEGVGHLKVEYPVLEPISAADPVAGLLTFTATEQSSKTDTE